MTNVIKRFSFLLFAFASVVTGCQKPVRSDNPGPQPLPGNVKLIKATNDDGHIDLDYHTNGLLKTMSVNIGSEPVDYTMNYNEDKRISRLHSAFADINYTYQAGRLVKTETFVFNKRLAYTDFTYTNDKLTRIAAFSIEVDDNNQTHTRESLRTEFTYTAAGDVKTAVDYTINPLNNQLQKSGTHKFLGYDTKKNATTLFGDLAISFFAEPNSHNVLKEEVLDEDDQLVETIEYAYTYNANGYPDAITETTKPAGGTAIVTHSQFIYK